LRNYFTPIKKWFVFFLSDGQLRSNLNPSVVSEDVETILKKKKKFEKVEDEVKKKTKLKFKGFK
jgi:hypothetical protein